jgi:hypothetical protein
VSLHAGLSAVDPIAVLQLLEVYETRIQWRPHGVIERFGMATLSSFIPGSCWLSSPEVAPSEFELTLDLMRRPTEGVLPKIILVITPSCTGY